MAMLVNKSPNQLAIEAFAAKFDPPLAPVQMGNINGQAVHDGWMCALHIPELEMGVTAAAWGKGHVKVWIEMNGYVADAVDVAMVVVAAFQYARNLQQAPKATTLTSEADEVKPATPTLTQASLAATDAETQDLGPSDADAMMGAAAIDPQGACQHDFQEPQPGARKRCWKCGLQEPKALPVDDFPKAE